MLTAHANLINHRHPTQGSCSGAPARRDPTSGRLWLSEGPIDLCLDLDGPDAEMRHAETLALGAFRGLLDMLVTELPLLREAVTAQSRCPAGPVAQRMMGAVCVHLPQFVTPMAAVAGAVADHLLGAITAGSKLNRAAINNGGDIALYLGKDARYRIGISDGRQPGPFAGVIDLVESDGVGGIATSGWRGRSHSLGIADAVTVLAKSAADADVAATLIANAVNLPDSALIIRRPACTLAPDSDLGERSVTVAVAALSDDDRLRALTAGAARAKEMVALGRVRAVFLALQGQVLVVDDGTIPNARIQQRKEY
ncbi:MAG: UPF0280 family protein [Albidovulum sp.]